MLEKIKSESLLALKSGNKPRREVLSFIEAQFKNEKIKLKKILDLSGTDLTDNDCLNVLKKVKKQLDETLESAKLGNRTDLISKCEFDLSVVAEFLPSEPTDESLGYTIDAFIESENLSSMKDMGQLINRVLAMLPTADKSKISKIAKEKLNGKN